MNLYNLQLKHNNPFQNETFDQEKTKHYENNFIYQLINQSLSRLPNGRKPNPFSQLVLPQLLNCFAFAR